MFRITEGPSSGSLVQCLAKNYRNYSIVSIDMDNVGVMAAYIYNIYYIHNIYNIYYIHDIYNIYYVHNMNDFIMSIDMDNVGIMAAYMLYT